MRNLLLLNLRNDENWMSCRFRVILLLLNNSMKRNMRRQMRCRNVVVVLESTPGSLLSLVMVDTLSVVTVSPTLLKNLRSGKEIRHMVQEDYDASLPQTRNATMSFQTTHLMESYRLI